MSTSGILRARSRKALVRTPDAPFGRVPHPRSSDEGSGRRPPLGGDEPPFGRKHPPLRGAQRRGEAVDREPRDAERTRCAGPFRCGGRAANPPTRDIPRREQCSSRLPVRAPVLRPSGDERPAEVVRRYFEIVGDLRSSAEALRDVLDPAVRIAERPNAIHPQDTVRGRAAAVAPSSQASVCWRRRRSRSSGSPLRAIASRSGRRGAERSPRGRARSPQARSSSRTSRPG
jgi:hypothetical protein